MRPEGCERVVVVLEEENGIHLPAELTEHPLESLGLRHSTNDTVENDAARHLRTLERLLHDGEDDIVGNQLAAIHVSLSGLPRLGAFPHGGPQHISGCNLRNPEAPRNRLGLRSLPGARRSEQDDDQERKIAPSGQRAIISRGTRVSGNHRTRERYRQQNAHSGCPATPESHTPTLLHEAVVLPQEQCFLELLHRIEPHADDEPDKQRCHRTGTAREEVGIQIGRSAMSVRKPPWQGDAADDVIDVLGRFAPGFTPE